MRTIRLALLLGLVPLLMVARATLGGELLGPERTIEEVVDHYVDAGIIAAGTRAAPEADASTLVRRVTLDLLGRIPTPDETRSYVESTDPDRRVKLVDRLMASPGFVRHEADSLDAMMMAGIRGSLRDYLVSAVRDRRPWDQVFREVMTADESDPSRKGVGEFLKARAKDTDKLTTDVSMVFFGVNVSCAKCHDHPLVEDWKQDHYYGMKSFLDRTYVVGNFVGEHGYGQVKYKTTAGEEKKARFLFLTGREAEVGGSEEPSGEAKKEEKKKIDQAKKKNEAPPAPEISARAKLVEVALDPSGREFFAKAIVNRLWNRFYGQGLVMPLDQMHSENPPSHPELLQWLARDMVEHGYDLRRLTRGLVLSHAYARESRADSENPDPRLFGVASPRALTPLQLAASMWVATGEPVASPDDDESRSNNLAGRAKNFAQAIAKPGDDYQIGAAEALFMSNSTKLGELLDSNGDRLIGRLAKIADRRERVELAVRTVLSRPADEEEMILLGDFLARREDRPVEAARQLVWALLAGGEFRFNH